MLYRRVLLGGAICLIAAGGTVLGADYARGRAYRDEHVDISGVDNAGRAGSHLLRGAQPSTTGFHALRRLGVDTVVSFTTGDDDVSGEQAVVEGLGMRYVHLPWSAMHEPPPEHLSAFLALLHEHPNDTVFVHCKAGADRTGAMIASYRVLVEHWSPRDAIAEMNAFGFHWLFHPQLQAYVYALDQTARSSRVNSRYAAGTK